MTIDAYNSKKLRVLNLILILLVVYIHSYYLEAVAIGVAKILEKYMPKIYSILVGGRLLCKQ